MYEFNPRSNSNYVAGANAEFHITKDTLFKITYQGAADNFDNNAISIELQILVNDHIISRTELKPNTGGDGLVHYKLTQFDDEDQEEDLGDLHLATFSPE
ncbi:unnamed protein product [Didymodactylos carnosus]|uniref:Uncharacterized protein n=1 Tax=Didymodactylos carnosus TaxID=1234261 RepID=A0A814DJA5_9BILA|nr:unnamed protein product [Didymodactylos carnosus]CAF3729772.1 unnamed protein product [Didymodactylos carnosus]